MKPSGNDRNTGHSSQRLHAGCRRQSKNDPPQASASMSSPQPTMMRNAKNGISTGGRSALGIDLMPISRE